MYSAQFDVKVDCGPLITKESRFEQRLWERLVVRQTQFNDFFAAKSSNVLKLGRHERPYLLASQETP